MDNYLKELDDIKSQLMLNFEQAKLVEGNEGTLVPPIATKPTVNKGKVDQSLNPRHSKSKCE